MSGSLGTPAAYSWNRFKFAVQEGRPSSMGRPSASVGDPALKPGEVGSARLSVSNLLGTVQSYQFHMTVQEGQRVALKMMDPDRVIGRVIPNGLMGFRW